MFPHGFTLTVHRAGGTDRFGNPLPGTSHTIDGCAVSPSGSTELVNGQATVTAEDRVYAPYDADVTAQDEIEIPAGQPIAAGRYQIDGEPQRWRNPFTGLDAGTVVRLTRTEG